MRMLIEILEGNEILLALIMVALFVAMLVYMAADGSYRRRAEKKFMADADRIKERTEERDLARDDAFELREELKKARTRIQELEHSVAQLEYDKKQLTKWGK